MKQKTVLIPPIVNFSILKQLPQQMAEQFAKNGYRVIFCNESQDGVIHRINENLITTGNFQEIINDVKSGRLKIDILYNTWAKHYDLVDVLKPSLTIYHSCDSFDDWKIYEQKMINRSDVILCTSQYIYDIREKQHNNVHLCRNGCDSSFFNTELRNIPEISQLEGMKFGMIGACGIWVSTYLMRNLAKKYNTFFVGSEFGKSIPNNVINLGLKEHKELAHYYGALDVSLLPFNTKSEIVQACNPIKLYESLAVGVPVLATSWSETRIDEFDGVVFCAENDDDYTELADHLANLSNTEKQIISSKAISIAKNNTWEKRFEIIQDLL